MAKTYINHNEVQNMLFGESTLDSKERDVKNVLKQHGIGDEFSYFEKILANKTVANNDKINIFLESFDLSENSKFQIKKKLNEIMYTEEDEENLEEIPDEEASSEEPESMEDNEDEDLETEDSEEESDEMEDEEESEDGDINVSDMDLDSKLDLVQKVIDSVSEEDFEDFMNSLTDLLSEYEGSEGDSEDEEDSDSEGDSEDEEDYPDFEEDEDLEEDDES
jgi:hypothetical protein